jgi:hypothetical protein
MVFAGDLHGGDSRMTGVEIGKIQEFDEVLAVIPDRFECELSYLRVARMQSEDRGHVSEKDPLLIAPEAPCKKNEVAHGSTDEVPPWARNIPREKRANPYGQI